MKYMYAKLIKDVDKELKHIEKVMGMDVTPGELKELKNMKKNLLYRKSQLKYYLITYGNNDYLDTNEVASAMDIHISSVSSYEKRGLRKLKISCKDLKCYQLV